MDSYRRYSVLIGLFLLTCSVILLLSSPGSFLSKQVSFITSELYHSSGNDLSVKTKMDFGDNEHMQSFPNQIGDWDGFDYDASDVQELLGADVILLRAYDEPGLYQPLFFTIMQAETESSFHPPVICYQSQGYKIAEESKDTVSILDTSWIDEGTLREIPVNRLSVYKERNGEVTERRVVLYYYVRGNRFASDTVTMVEIQALAPLDGSYDGILGEMKTFASQTVPYMFEPANEQNEGSTLLERMLQHGAVGYVIVIILVSIPVVVAIYPYLKMSRGVPKNTAAKSEQ